MERKEIEKIIDTAFDTELSHIQADVNRELYPAAFADESSWLHVRALFELNNEAIRQAVKASLSEIVAALD